jgi:hypothetical protein
MCGRLLRTETTVMGKRTSVMAENVFMADESCRVISAKRFDWFATRLVCLLWMFCRSDCI